MAKDNLLKKAFDYASKRAFSTHIDDAYIIMNLRQKMREYLDRYDKNVTDEEIEYFIKEQMKEYRRIKQRGKLNSIRK